MSKVLSILLLFFLFQSCYTYKSATVDSLEVKKNYIIQLKRGGKEIDGKYISKTKDSVQFRVNKQAIYFPVSEIKYVKRKKVSVVMIVGTVTAVTIGTVILLDKSDNDKGNINDIPTPNN